MPDTPLITPGSLRLNRVSLHRNGNLPGAVAFSLWVFHPTPHTPEGEWVLAANLSAETLGHVRDWITATLEAD